jgi:hypothetical protein
VLRGGWLMEYYLWSTASYSAHELYKDYTSTYAHILHDDTHKTQAFDKILDKVLSHFVGWVLFTVSSVGAKGRRQLFYVTFANHYFGLSREGINVNHRFGFGIALTKFDEIQHTHQELAQQNAIDRKRHAHVGWWDNFSKFLKFGVPTLQKNVFASCLWTGVTINEYKGPEVDIDIKYVDNNIVPAMPDNILLMRDRVMRKLERACDSCNDYFPKSLVKQFNVCNIPLKIDTAKFPGMKDVIESDRNTMKFIHSDTLLKINIGSNAGLATILREFEQDNKMHLPGMCSEYKTINLDENIYYRTLKVTVGCVCLCRVCIPCKDFVDGVVKCFSAVNINTN